MLLLKIIGFVLLFFVLIITVFVAIFKLFSHEYDNKDRIALNIDDINRIWKANCPSFSSVQKRGCDLFRIDISNDEEKQKYQEWLSTLPNNFPYQYMNNEDVRGDFSYIAERVGLLENYLRERKTIVIGGLYLMSEDEEYLGNFIFGEDWFVFEYDISRISIFREEMEDLGCPLPEFSVLSFAGHAVRTDFYCKTRVKFVNPIMPAYNEKLKRVVLENESNGWSYHETEDDMLKVDKDSGSCQDTHITFWKDNDGNSLADMSYSSF